MVVTWTTPNRTARSVVWFSKKDDLNFLDQTATGNFTALVDGGNSEKRTVYIHRVYLSNLSPDSVYRKFKKLLVIKKLTKISLEYAVGSSPSWKKESSSSKIFSFRTYPNRTENWSPRMAVFGDVSVKEWHTFDHLLGQVYPLQKDSRKPLDMIFHLGDIAYDLHSEGGRLGDRFMRHLEPLAASLPYQVCPGNHEAPLNFSHYDGRFSMLSQSPHQESSKSKQTDDPLESINNHYYSFNLGRAHFIAYSTEFHFFKDFASSRLLRQLQWLEDDLEAANRPEARALRPWIITIGHRPMYSHFGPAYDREGAIVRDGSSGTPGFEQLFYRYGVDLQLAGHIHNYERQWPVVKGAVKNGSRGNAYFNPRAPVHIITGAAGNRRMSTAILPRDARPPYSAFVSNVYSYTVLTVANGSHLFLEQVDEKGKTIDEIFIRKNRPRPAWL